eukprot:5751854-Pleurochrysis_carterae.AAC.1
MPSSRRREAECPQVAAEKRRTRRPRARASDEALGLRRGSGVELLRVEEDVDGGHRRAQPCDRVERV